MADTSLGDPLGDAAVALQTILETEISIDNGCLFDAADRVTIGGDFDDGAAEWSIDGFAGEYEAVGFQNGITRLTEEAIFNIYFTAPAQDKAAPFLTYSKMNNEILNVLQNNETLANGEVIRFDKPVERMGWRSEDNTIIYGLIYFVVAFCAPN